MQPHMKINVGKSLACQIAGFFDLRAHFGAQLFTADSSGHKRTNKILVKKLAVGVQQGGYPVQREYRNTDNRIDMTTRGYLGMPSNQGRELFCGFEINIYRQASNRAELDALLDGAGNAGRKAIAIGINDQIPHGRPKSCR